MALVLQGTSRIHITGRRAPGIKGKSISITTRFMFVVEVCVNKITSRREPTNTSDDLVVRRRKYSGRVSSSTSLVARTPDDRCITLAILRWNSSRIKETVDGKFFFLFVSFL